jgi:hypothetical protein
VIAGQTRHQHVATVEIGRRQWRDYAHFHQSRANLLLHAAAVPVFLAGNIGLVLALLHADSGLGSIAATATAVSLAVQGLGHRREPLPPEPFASAGNAIVRIVLEQWVTFPRFVLSGRWRRAWRADVAEPASDAC